MRRSEFFLKTSQAAPKGETSANAKLLTRGGFIDKLMAGAYTILPLGWRVMRKIENIIREEMLVVGGQEIFMPAFQPKENWERTGRWKTYEDLYRLKDGNKEYALGPTHEEIIVPLAKKYILSYRDLPLYLFQIQNKFRKEPRAKSGLLRGREFLMKDLYSFHIDEGDLERYYERLKKTYAKIFERVGIGDKTYLTFASGGSFSKYSHEFQTLTEAGEDIIYICDKCRVAVNREIIGEVKNSCPECGSKKLREEKAIEVGNIFQLKTKFSQPFGLSFVDKKGNKKPVIMGCYGIGLQRLMGTIVEVYNDNKGIIWPEAVAPFQVVLIGIDKGDCGSKVRDFCEKVYKQMADEGVEALYDDRWEVSAGEKFADADLLGIPYRIVVSEKTMRENKVEVKGRAKDEIRMMSAKELADVLGRSK